MRSIEMLRAEHRMVRALLRCLEALADEAHLHDRLDRDAAARVLTLLERFVDWSHQDKEERVLFPLLLARAEPGIAQEVARLFQEHVQERRRLIGMWLHLEGAARGDLWRLQRFVDHARTYLVQQLHHIEEEETEVLPLAEKVLTAEDDELLVEGFERLDRRLGGLRSLRDQVRGLCRRFDLHWTPQEGPISA